MRSALLERTVRGSLACFFLFACLLAPACSQDGAEPEQAPAAAEVDRNHPHVNPDAPDEFHHEKNDLSHNDGTNMLEAPHEPSLELAVFTLLVFLGLVIVLGKFAWPPILNGLKARESSMEGKMKKAEEMYEQANAKLAEYTRKLSESQQEIKAMRDDTIKAADEKSRQIVEAAQQSASAERERALREIDAAKGAAINELAQASVNLAVDLAGQITRKELTAADHANLIQDSISKLPSSN